MKSKIESSLMEKKKRGAGLSLLILLAGCSFLLFVPGAGITTTTMADGSSKNSGQLPVSAGVGSPIVTGTAIDARVGKDMYITAAVFSQAEDPAMGIQFTYRVGSSPLVWFGTSEVYYTLGNETLHLQFYGSNIVVPKGIDPLQSKTSYFRGSDPSKWRAGLVDYGAIVYEDLYPGIDLTYKTTEVGLKYEFHVKPGNIRRDA